LKLECELALVPVEVVLVEISFDCGFSRNSYESSFYEDSHKLLAVASLPPALAFVNFTVLEFAFKDAASYGDQLSLAMWFVI